MSLLRHPRQKSLKERQLRMATDVYKRLLGIQDRGKDYELVTLDRDEIRYSIEGLYLLMTTIADQMEKEAQDGPKKEAKAAHTARPYDSAEIRATP